MSTIVNVADAVVAQLGSASLSQPIVAERLYVPNFELEDLKEIQVSVVPRELHVRGLDRRRNQYDAEIDVAVQKKIKKGDAAEIDPLMQLVEEISDLFRLTRLASFPGAIWTGTNHRVLYSPEHWDQLNLYTSLLTFTFRLAR